jgi:hypothetical protein
MMKISRRLKRLEEKLNDGSGLVPHTPAWTAYWMGEMDKGLPTASAVAGYR